MTFPRAAGAVILAFTLASFSPARAQSVVPDAGGLVGEWSGAYVCGQGRTGLRLTITEGGHGGFRGMFGFFALPSNPEAKSGRYSITGFLNQATGAIAINADAWIERPEGYETVNLKGRLNAAADTISGIVDHVSCTSFEVKREIYAGSGSQPAALATLGAAGASPAQGGPALPVSRPDPAFTAALYVAFSEAESENMALRRGDPKLGPGLACLSSVMDILPDAEKRRLIETAAMPQGSSRAKALGLWLDRVVRRHPDLVEAAVPCG